MRILHVVARSQHRGAETAALVLAAELDRRGHTDRVVALQAAFDGTVVADLPSLAPRAGTVGLARRLRRELRERPVDLVLAHGGEPAFVAALATAVGGRRVPIVWQRILGFPDAVWRSAPRRARWRWVDRRAAAVVVLTAELAAEQARLGRTGPVWLIPNFRDPAPFLAVDHAAAAAALRAELQVPAGRALVGLVGALTGQKRPDRAVRVVAEALGRGADLHLVVAGSGPDRAAVEEQVRAAGLAEHVTFVGHRDDLPQLLAALDVLLLTSDAEGIPGILVEARLAGCPVVTVAVGGVAEVVAHEVTGLVVPGSEAALAASLAELLADPDRLTRYRVAARADIERFDVATAADAYESGCIQLLGGGGGS